MDEPAMSLLVLGGARSGKSGYAQALAEGSGLAPTFVATAEAFDDEMAERIRAHRAVRDGRWRTVEAPRDLVAALEREAGPGRVVLVDCLTLWLSNLVLGDADAEAAGDDLAALVPRLAGPVILVSNEVGAGIVPDTALGRRFRDAQGRLNAKVAGTCGAVVLVAAGLPLLLKPRPAPGFRF